MWCKQSTAATLIVGPILDSAGAEYTSAVIGDLSISKNGGTLTALAAAATLTHIANGQYTLVMTTGNLDTLGRLQITCNKSTYQMPPVGLNVVPAMVFDSMVLGTDVLQSDTIQFGGTNGTFDAGKPTAVLDSSVRVKLDATQPDYVPATASALSSVSTTLSTLAGKFSGITLLADWLRRMLRKDSGTAGMIAAEAEITTGGTTTYLGTTDNVEAVRDAISASSGGGGGSGAQAVVVARVAIGVTVGWPEEIIVNDAYLSTTLSAPKLFIKDIDENILNGLGSKMFSDADFVGELRLSPLTDSTKDLETPLATIVVSTEHNPGIVYNDATEDAEFFYLQMPRSATTLGKIRTRYSAQFVMNWGGGTDYERTVNLGEIKFIRKNTAS